MSSVYSGDALETVWFVVPFILLPETEKGRVENVWKGETGKNVRGTRILLVCPFAKLQFLLLDGGFTRKLYLSAGKRGQQQEALNICTKNVQLWHPFLTKGDSSETFEMW
jgi:hypothetical protein